MQIGESQRELLKTTTKIVGVLIYFFLFIYLFIYLFIRLSRRCNPPGTELH